MSFGRQPPEIERVAVVGAGAMGGMYAAHLAEAGVPVVLVARGDRARRLAEDGLVVNGRPLVAPADVDVYDAAEGAPVEPVDLVVIAVKHHQLAEALDDVAGLVGPETTWLSVLNGLDSEELIADRFGADGVLLSIALAMDAMRDGNRITFRQAGRIVFGEADNSAVTPRVEAVQRVLDRAGLAWQTPADMRHAMWWKFMVNVGINQASAVLRAPYGDFRQAGDARELMWALIDEVVAVASAEGIDLVADDLRRWDEVLANQPVDGMTSMHQDVEAGRPTEVDIFAGRVVALGERHGIATPYNRAMGWILRHGARR